MVLFLEIFPFVVSLIMCVVRTIKSNIHLLRALYDLI